MSEHIQHEQGDDTAWLCLCGNTPHTSGFTPCDRSGDEMEPDEDWHGLYRCNACQRIIDQQNRKVIGSAPSRYRFTWSGIEIEAAYTPRKWGVIAHLEIRSIAPAGAPLPITSTGYRSHFHPCGTVETHGGNVVAQVTAWLEEEAGSREWRAHGAATRQGELF